jgi:ADP-heptose:LPS heptosyltransferase
VSARRALVVRSDNIGDVLLAGPAVRAVAASGIDVTVLCGPNGRAAAELLPAVADVWEFRVPWIDPDGQPVVASEIDALVRRVAAAGFDEALVLTSFHQSALPMALLLRMAGVATIAGNSEDFPGTLLDVRHRPPDDVHEVERNLSLVRTLGHELPADDDGALRITERGPAAAPPFAEPYVVVHPGASVPARAWSPDANRATVDALVDAGWRVAVTGGGGERALTEVVSGPRRVGVVDLGGATDLAGLAAVIRGAAAVVVGNTGAAHVAAAVGTPVVSIFAPTVPVERWHPWRVPHVVLGHQDIGCRHCRARACPVAGHPCVSTIEPGAVVAAVAALVDAVPQRRREGAA